MSTMQRASWVLWSAVHYSLLSSVFAEEWRVGRASYYSGIHNGSCGFGFVNSKEGLGYNIAALPDVHPDYKGSCGSCYEVECHQMDFFDRYGSKFQRSENGVCQDRNNSMIVKVIDECSCNSNQRWCCGDMDHINLSKHAFSKLAADYWGVIGLRFRRVDCPDDSKDITPKLVNNIQSQTLSTKTGTVATSTPSKPVFSSPPAIPASSKNEFAGTTSSVFEGGFSKGFVDGGLVPYQPVNSDGYGGRPAWCSLISGYRGVAILGDRKSFQNGAYIEFWVKLTHGVPDVSVALAADKILLGAVRLHELKVSAKDTASNMGLYMIDMNKLLGAPAVAPARNGTSLKADSIVFVNNLSWGQGLCVDSIKIIRTF